MAAPAPLHREESDPFVAVRALNRLRAAGFTLRVDGADLVVSPFSRLSAEQRDTIRAHKPALVALLQDAETLLENLTLHGPAGLGWLEGTPDWTGERLLAAGEVLYANGRMINRDGRRYGREYAPTGGEPPDRDTAPAPAPAAALPVVALTPDAKRLLDLYAAKPGLATAAVKRLNWTMPRFDMANGELVIARRVEFAGGWKGVAP